MYEPVRARVNMQRAPGDLFPLMKRDELRVTAPGTMRLVGTEVVREGATLLMLAGVALAAAREWRLWLPAFAVAFGTWDIFYYVFLRVLAGWPASLLTWDVLFLIPVPWAAPVLAPVIVALSIVAMGLVSLRGAVRTRMLHRIALGVGGCLILVSFMWDSPNLLAGWMPHPFAWTIFGAGELLGVGAFAHAVRTSALRSTTVAAGVLK
jgi:hypothetical protein